MALLGPYATMEEALAACEQAIPPVCYEQFCPSGAPQTYTLTLSGGTDTYAQLNGAWTLSYVSGTGWVGVLGSCTATMTLSGDKSPNADATIVFEAPGYPTLLTVGQTTAASFNCCAVTPLSISKTGGKGTSPTLGNLTPDGACGCGSGDICCDAEGEPLVGQPLLNLNSPDSAYAGDYTLTFDTDHYQSAEFTVAANDYYWKLTCSGTVWTLELYQNAVLHRDGTYNPGNCPNPFTLTFTGADFDTMGNIVVTIL